MKNGKNPTRRQKQAMMNMELNPAEWLVYQVESDRLHIVHRTESTVRIIPA